MDKSPNKSEAEIREDAKRSALEKVKQKVSIVNIEELAENEARKAADANMTESQGKAGFFRKLWKHTFFDEYYRQKEVNKVREDIKNTGNIYTGRIQDGDRIAHENTMKAISDRFTSEYEGTLADGEAKKILDEKDPETVKARTDIKNIIDSYAMSKIDDEAFNNEKVRIINGLNKDDLFKGANNYADNLFEIAQNARLAIEHGAKMEELDYDLDIVVGKAKSSLRTEAHFNWVDMGIDKMKKSQVGRFISPAVLSTGIGLAYSLSVGLSKKVMSSKAAAYATLGGSVAVSAVFAGMNESQRVALERKQHGIEMAEGGSIEAGDKRREQMEKYQYKMETSEVLAQNLRDLMFKKDKDGKDVAKDIKQEDVDKIIASLSEIDARKSINVRNKIDLISYSNISNVEKESTDLTILTARAKVELTKKLEGSLKGGLPNGETFDSYLAKQTQIVEDTLLGGEKGVTSQDKSFRKYKAGRIAKKMAQTAVMGLVIGGTIQEGMAFLKDDVQGLAEGLFHHDIHATMQTPFQSIHDYISGNPSHMDMGNAVAVDFNGHALNFPEGTSLVNNTDGTVDLLRGDQVVSSHFLPTFDTNGELDAASVARLGQDGIIATAAHQIIDSTKEVTGDAHNWIQNHPGSTMHVARDLWYENNTPMVPDPANPGHLIGANLNELGIHWGGINGTGINASGDAVLNISHMTPAGSFQDGFSANAQEAMHKGTLMAMISLDGSTQGHIIPVPIDASGNIVFDHNNPLMHQLFKPDASGHMSYHGKFLEIVEKMGVDKNGVEHVKPLGTLIGEGLSSIKDIIPSHQDIAINSLSPSLATEMPYDVSLVSRRPLGPVIYDKDGQETKTPKTSEENKIPNNENIIVGPVGPWKAEEDKKPKVINEVSQKEYDGMKDDLKMLNQRIQSAEGIINLQEGDFKSEYGKKRYNELKSISDGKPVTFNKTELQNVGDEMEGTLRNSKVIEKKARTKSLTAEEKKAQEMKVNMKSDLEMLNKRIQGGEGIINLGESDFKSEYGKKRYKELNSIVDGKPVIFNKGELEDISKELEGKLSGPKKLEPVVNKTPINKAPISEPKEEIPESVEAEVFKVGDLSKIGTEFSNNKYKYKVIGTSSSFLGLFGNKIKVESENKITGEKKIGEYSKKEVERNFNNGDITITKVAE